MSQSFNKDGVFITLPDQQSIDKAKEYIQLVMKNEIVKVEED